MERSLTWRIPLCLVIIAAGVLVVMVLPMSQGKGIAGGVSRGIDLAGGVAFTYEINVSEVPPDKQSDLTERTTSVVRKRLDPEGVKDLTIRPVGQYRFEIQMPKPAGASDEDVQALVREAKNRIGKVGRLEFRVVADEEVEKEAEERGGAAPPGFKKFPVAPDERHSFGGKDYAFVVFPDDYEVTGSYLKGVSRGQDQAGRPAVDFEFNDKGAKRFERLTGDHQGKRLAIILDGQIQSAPTIKSEISRRGIIEGGDKGFSPQEQGDLIAVLNAGSLDAPVSLVSENVVGGQLGEENISKAVRAALIATALVVIFMAGYYLVGGLIANFALAINLLLVLAIMSLLDATLTLPGIAGLVLTLGMAVDANVLIFERIREEKRTHLALPLAIQNGYDRAFITILDSNLTTMIAAVMLYFFGTEAIKGFGITLTLGLLASMFTQLFVTRTIFMGLVSGGVLKKMPMLKIIGVPKINFLKFRWGAIIVSLTFIALGAVAFFSRPMQQNLGTDFTGGTKIQLTLNKEMLLSEINKRLADHGYPDASIQTVQRIGEARPSHGYGKSLEIAVRDTALDTVEARVLDALKDNLPAHGVDFEASPPVSATTADLDSAKLDTADRGVFKFGKKTVVTLREAMPLQDVTARFDRVVQREKAAGRDFGPYKVVAPVATAGAPVTEFTLFTEKDKTSEIDSFINRALAGSPFTGVTNFGSKVAKGMQRDALIAIAASLVLILIYVRFRFGGWSYGLGGIVALAHDALIAVSFLSFGWVLAKSPIGTFLMIQDFKIDLTIIAALLTIIGYSINDTIVTFDRIRENMGGRRDRRVTAEVVNLSVNQTLSRTILTSLTVFFVVIVLYIWGGEGVHGFAFAMIIGVFTGSYSTIYIAPPFLLGWRMPEIPQTAPAGKNSGGKTADKAKK